MMLCSRNVNLICYVMSIMMMFSCIYLELFSDYLYLALRRGECSECDSP